MGKSSINGPFSMAMLNNQRDPEGIYIYPLSWLYRIRGAAGAMFAGPPTYVTTDAAIATPGIVGHKDGLAALGVSRLKKSFP